MSEQQRQDLRIAFQEQEDRDQMVAQQHIQQQLFASRQQHLSDQERRDAGLYLISLGSIDS
ncbi:hypothetical protein FRB95_010362 [Tulasnella sp. JGI-2019a]|nr:hypothetical protein FRB95_010362 [Tulasnella sp. JGI-2019a]